MAGMASGGIVLRGGNADGQKVKIMLPDTYMGSCGILLVGEVNVNYVSFHIVNKGENPKKLEIESAKQEVISTKAVGLLLPDKNDTQFIKNTARFDERGTILIGIGVGLLPKSVEYPKRYGG